MVKQKGETKFVNRYWNGLRPAMYIIFTIALTLLDFSVLGVYSLFPLFLIIPGYLVGVALTRRVKFRTDEKGVHYYMRPRATLALYLVAVAFRVFAELFFPASFIRDIVVNSLLGLATGILVGEARLVRMKAEHHMNLNPSNQK